MIIDLPRSRRCRRAGEESGARLDIPRDAALDGAILDINLDGQATDLEAECRRYEALLRVAPLDIACVPARVSCNVPSAFS